jgi:hypothetical protein
MRKRAQRAPVYRSPSVNMAVFKSQAEVVSGTGQSLGDGTAYLHLPRGPNREQDVGGTISLKAWSPTEDAPAALRFADGRRLEIRVSRDALSECSRNRVLRFQAHWPPPS